MPLLPFLRKAAGLPPPPTTTYYLASPPTPSHALLQPLHATPRQLPPGSLLLALIHPDLAGASPAVKAARFFLEALPDPVGFAYHAANYAASHLVLGESGVPHVGGHGGGGDESEQGEGGQGEQSGYAARRWRHQMVQIELEDKPGLAATAAGHIGISLHWVADIMRQVRTGERDMASATREFKGVLLHELVHTIQHDGAGSAPGWLIESIADHVRLLARLGPPHWRAPGQGRPDRGWEDAYDAGARFLEWLTAPQPPCPPAPTSAPPSLAGKQQAPAQPPTEESPFVPSHTGAQPPAQTVYHPAPTGSAPRPVPGKQRSGPWPELVRAIDTRLREERWDDAWWAEMTGRSLDQLWQEYLVYYKPS
ncbi:hypothetical protein Q5752_003815 [Cryptotrichosporon argae]